MNEQEPTAEVPEGVRWLELVGQGDLVGKLMDVEVNGVQRRMPFEEYDQICGHQVRPLIAIIENFAPETPEYAAAHGQFMASIDHFKQYIVNS